MILKGERVSNMKWYWNSSLFCSWWGDEYFISAPVTAFPGATPPRVSICWHRWIPSTAACPGRSPKSCVSGPCVFLNNQNINHLAEISVSHLYNLRQYKPYQRVRQHFEKTRPKSSSIGERRKPQADNQPGYIRVDTVHQSLPRTWSKGDLDRIKGVYHSNAVDEVSQFEFICSVEKISERYLIPILETLLQQFPLGSKSAFPQ